MVKLQFLFIVLIAVFGSLELKAQREEFRISFSVDSSNSVDDLSCFKSISLGLIEKSGIDYIVEDSLAGDGTLFKLINGSISEYTEISRKGQRVSFTMKIFMSGTANYQFLSGGYILTSKGCRMTELKYLYSEL